MKLCQFVVKKKNDVTWQDTTTASIFCVSCIFNWVLLLKHFPHSVHLYLLLRIFTWDVKEDRLGLLLHNLGRYRNITDYSTLHSNTKA